MESAYQKASSLALEHPKATAAVVGVAVGAAATPVVLASLAALGFSSTGVVAGTIASGWQSAHGVGAAFSLLQSCGAAGSIGAVVPVGAGAGAAAVVNSSLSSKDRERQEQEHERKVDQLKAFIQSAEQRIKALEADAQDYDKAKEELVALKLLLEENKQPAAGQEDLAESPTFRNALFLQLYKDAGENVFQERALKGEVAFKDMKAIRNKVAHVPKYIVSKENLQRLELLIEEL